MKNEPKYVRRRAVTAFVLLLIPTWLIGVGLTEPAYECEQIATVAVQGDSLWSVASEHCVGDIREATYNLSQKYGTTVHPGQIIEMP